MEKKRIVSLDIFRGITMILMILVNNPGDWGQVYPPLLHAEWHGWTPTDLVFPFFVFAMGMALPFSSENPELSGNQFIKILSRSLRLICLGLFLNFFSRIEFGLSSGVTLMLFRMMITGFIGFLLLGDFPVRIRLIIAAALFLLMIFLAYSGIPHFENVRLPGVLQRLGVIYFFTALIFHTCSFRTQFILGGIILLGYWLALTYIPVPGTDITGYEKGQNLAAWLDEQILRNHVWVTSKPWDPEGILSTLPAIVSCLIGVWAGMLVKIKADQRTLIFTGLAFLICGLIWDRHFPINKALWSSSLVLFSTGAGCIIVSALHFLLDGKKENMVSSFLVMWGVNPIIVFFGAGILPRALNMITINQEPMLYSFYKNGLVPLFDNPMNSSLAFAILNVLFWIGFLFYLKKIKLIIKV